MKINTRSFLVRIIVLLLLLTASAPVGSVDALKNTVPSPAPQFAHTGDLTPVTLSYFFAKQSGDAVDIEWSTATETGNIGFNLYAEQNGVRIRLNEKLIVSHGIDSLERQDYSFTAATNADTFLLEEVSFLMETNSHGPFELNRVYGGRAETKKIDWKAIQSQRASAPAAPQIVSNGPTPLAPSTPLYIKVNRTGLQRVTHQMLLNIGYNLVGVSINNIKLTSQGVAVPVYIRAGAGNLFIASSYIEFYGEALDTLYTDTNVYVLEVGAGGVRIAADATRPTLLAPPTAYTETLTVNNQNSYAIYSPGGDPWYDTYMQIDDRPNAWEYHFTLSALANPADSASMNLTLWGLTQWPANPDHHVIARINGVQVGDLLFDGLSENVFNLIIPGNTLQNGDNILRLELPADQGLAVDVVTLDSFSVSYQRSFQAVNGGLTFTTASPNRVVQVTNLPSNSVVVYRMTPGGPVRLTSLIVQSTGGGTYKVRFTGTIAASQYIVSTIAALNAPTLENPPSTAGLNTPAQYLIISHPDFLGGLGSLVAARQGQGLTVNVVNVNSVYAQYSYGVFDPQAIKDYITYAQSSLGTEYVLLIGGDTYDYRNHLGLNSISFIPSLYTSVGPFDTFMPADPLYADTDDNGLPNLPIGRFPVRTTAELTILINKTLAYAGKTYDQTAVFVADEISGAVSFKTTSLAESAGLPGGWTITNIFLDDTDVATANSQLIAAINAGTALVAFNGHSNPYQWSFANVLDMTDAAALTNSGKPFVGAFLGCWNTYYVDPVNDTLLQTLLLAGDFGAAAIMGTTSRADAESQDLLGLELFNSYLTTPSLSIGDALQLAKSDLFLSHPGATDAIFGFTIMGDPVLVVDP